MQEQVWIIDDEQAICWALKRALEQAGYVVTAFSNAEDAIAILTDTPRLDAVLLDMRMPGMDGFEATGAIKKLRPSVPIIMMTAFGDLSSAMHAMDLDIFEYLTKPFDLTDGLKSVAKAISSTTNQATNRELADSIQYDTLVGSSPAMQQVYKQIALASRSDVSVLISGPSGIEKESIASAIHRNSRRQSAPFLAFVPIAISPIAVATELLGSVQSRNTKVGIMASRSGAFELAGSGILYIDEVSDLPLSLQAQLLRVLEKKKYNRLGDSTECSCSSRIVASTSRNLRAMVAEGEFMEELRQRLSVFSIELVPLAERREDILPLALAILNSHTPGRNLTFSVAAIEWLTAKPWPGNIRELRSAIDNAVFATRGSCIVVDVLATMEQSDTYSLPSVAKDLVEEVRRWTLGHLDRLNELGQRIQSGHSDELFGTMYEDFLSTIEPPMLQAMMDASNRNRATIAAQLGMHRSTLRQKMRRYEIE